MAITAVDTFLLDPKSDSIEDKEKQARILRLKKACQQFEALFIQYMLKSMRSASEKSALLGDGLGSDIFMQMFDEGMAEKMSESSPFGIANSLYNNFTDSDLAEEIGRISYVPSKTINIKQNVMPGTVRRQNPAEEINLDKYKNIIDEAAAANSVNPHLVKAVIIQESGGNPNAVSSKGAKGLMQLMDGTAKMLGVADPFNIRQNIFGGVKYLSKLLKKFNGDVKKALAAYNAGPTAVIKYDGIPPYEETKKYVNSIMNTLEGLFKIEKTR